MLLVFTGLVPPDALQALTREVVSFLQALVEAVEDDEGIDDLLFHMMVILVYTVQVLDRLGLCSVLASLEAEQGGLPGETSKGIVVMIDAGGGLVDGPEPVGIIHLR